MRTLSASPLATLLLALLVFGLSGQAAYRFDDTSRLWIDGTSSLHDWTCETDAVGGTLQIDPATGAVAAARVRVPVASIECKNGTMNGKLRKALDAARHPDVAFSITRATTHTGGVDLQGTLSIAGVERPAGFVATAVPLGNGRYGFAGQYRLAMSDFGVDPPRAMLGTLKTGDEVTVRFDVVVVPR